MGTTISGWGVADATQFMWAMWWWPHAILHGLNPFVTHAVWVPDGMNLASATTIPLPAVVMAPLTALVGPVHGPIVSYNVATLLAPVISAWFAYRLCLYVTAAPAASILGGWLYGFCSFAIANSAAHLHLALTFGAPLMVLLTLRYYRGDIGRLRFVLLGALTLGCQLLCGTEVFFTTGLLGAVALLCVLAFAPRDERRRILGLIPPLIAAGLLTAVVCSPFLYYALTGPEVGGGQAFLYPADLLSFAIPTPITWLGGKSFLPVSGFYLGNLYEQGTYLGLPLIAIVIAAWAESFRRPFTRALMAVTLVAFVFSLGVTLSVDGHPTISLPFKLLTGQKQLNQVLPVRLGLYIELGAALSAAMWLSRPRSTRPWRWLLALLAVVFLFPNADAMSNTGQPLFRETYRSPALITQGLYRRYLPRNAVVMPIPFGASGTSLLWQAQAQGYFRLASGWFGLDPPTYQKGSNALVVSELTGYPSPSFTDPVGPMRLFLVTHDVNAVVILPGQAGQWPRVMSQLGLKRIAAGGVWLYHVPAVLPLPLAS